MCQQRPSALRREERGHAALGEGGAASNAGAAAAASKDPPRRKWSSGAEFTIACIGYAVGLGNFWRFPALCFNNGGGAFLVPYTLTLLLIGMPIFLLELGMGQKFQIGGAELWKRVHPSLGGLGVASITATAIVAVYYNVVVCWALWYFFRSFAWDGVLPWAESRGGALQFWEVDTLHCRPAQNLSSAAPETCAWGAGTTWPQEPGIARPGPLVWPLVGCLALGWVLVWLCVCKGVHSAGKVAWFTALFPYAVLLALLVRGLSLPGAHVGLKWYLTPSFDKLAEPQVWVAAASQIFYSTGIGWGTLPAFASYNRHDHNFARDAWLVPLINCGTSFLAGLVVFSVLGDMSQETGVPIDEMQIEGSGLAFVVYPQAIAKLPVAPLFALLFFTMLLCLGLDSEFSMVETILTAVDDAGVGQNYPRAVKAAAACLAMFSVGLLFVTRGGLHWLELVDGYAANLTLFIVGGVECLAVGWVYGADRFAADTLEMAKTKLPKALLWNYKLVVPALLAALTVQAFVSTATSKVHFPPYAVALGWCLALASALPIPLLAIRPLCCPPPYACEGLTSPRERAGLVGKLAASLHRLSRSLSFGASSRGASSAPAPSGLPPELSTERADVELTAARDAVRLEQ